MDEEVEDQFPKNLRRETHSVEIRRDERWRTGE